MNYHESLRLALETKKISKTAHENITEWLSQEKYHDYQTEIETLITTEKWQHLEDCFFKVVPFGTGGRRGTVGVGSNRINKVTLGESAQGMATYVAQANTDAKTQGVVIAYDTRLTSIDFAHYVAGVFAANGFTVYYFNSFRPTPELSFAVRHLKAATGVVISASHNPSSDNGFKAYWSDGGQIVPPHDEGIMSEVANVKVIKTMDFDEGVKQKVITVIGKDIDDAYTDAIVQESLMPSRSAAIVYSPLHGTGTASIWPVLQKAGFKNLTLVEEQASPDGHFPNIKNNIPNPEVREASHLVTERAQQLKADIGITTDPDADRLGVVARNDRGEYEFLTGNQIAALLGYFVLNQLKTQGKLSPQHFIAKTIVTTDFLTSMARDFGVKIYDQLLIGFKYIAELIKLHEGKEHFIFGGEESHGILKGTYTRDKDAAVAALLMAELASWLKDQNKTIPWQLDQLYRRYGIYSETLQTIMYPGAAGNETMLSIMKSLRLTPPTEISETPVVSITDRLTTEGTKGDVIILNLSADKQTRVTIRPSGTEPKLKIYTQVYFPIAAAISDEDLQQAKKKAAAYAAALSKNVATRVTK